jgi:hypothetical protein
MTTNISGSSDFPQSATIYAFPPRGRFAAGILREDLKPAASVQLPRGVKLASGSGWYHDAAIQAEQGAKV